MPVTQTQQDRRSPVDPVERPTSGVVDIRDLGELLRTRRTATGLTLRELQEQLGNTLTASSLSRIEHGAVPDPKNVPVLARWLDLNPNQIAWPGETSFPEATGSTPEVVELHLRADKKLSPLAVEMLSRTFRVLYEDIVGGKIPVVQGPEERRD
jgi:transcriptional regulator with XRE-family HTH domain